MRTSGSNHVKAPRAEPYPSLTGDAGLRARDQGLDVPECGIEVLSFVQPVPIEAGQLILPERLPFGEHQFFELAMGTDEEQRGARLEADTTLDAECGLSHVNVAPDPVLGGDLTQPFDQGRTGQTESIQLDGKPELPAEDDLTSNRSFWRIDQLGGWPGPGVVGPAAP